MESIDLTEYLYNWKLFENVRGMRIWLNKLSYIEVQRSFEYFRTELSSMKRKKNILVLNLFFNAYPLLESELILKITFEPQGIDYSAIQPSH